MGILASGIALGGVLGIWLGGRLEAAYGWRIAFMAVSVPGFVLAAAGGPAARPGAAAPVISIARGPARARDRAHCAGPPVPAAAARPRGRRRCWRSSSTGSTAPTPRSTWPPSGPPWRSASRSISGIWVRRLARRRPRGTERAGARVRRHGGVAGTLVLRTPTLVYIFVGRRVDLVRAQRHGGLGADVHVAGARAERGRGGGAAREPGDWSRASRARCAAGSWPTGSGATRDRPGADRRPSAC